MLTPIIGENAGKIWQVLHDKGKLPLSELKKITELDDKKLHLSLGWLARESKIQFIREQRQLMVELT